MGGVVDAAARAEPVGEVVAAAFADTPLWPDPSLPAAEGATWTAILLVPVSKALVVMAPCHYSSSFRVRPTPRMFFELVTWNLPQCRHL